MANMLLRDRAQKLRREGMSLNEITKELSVPKSTVRFWCKDIILSRKQQARIFQKIRLGGVLSAEKLRKQRIATIDRFHKQGVADIGRLTKRDVMIAGVALYWAEGYRKGDGEFGFTNLDPNMVRFVLKWLREACGIHASAVHVRICINESHKKRLKEVQDFWWHVTKLPANQFSKPTFIKVKNKKQYLNSSEHFGTLRIKVRKSTNLRRKVVGWISGLSKVS